MTEGTHSLVERLRENAALLDEYWMEYTIGLLRAAADQIAADAARIKKAEADLEKAELSAYACPNCYQRANRCTCDVKLV